MQHRAARLPLCRSGEIKERLQDYPEFEDSFARMEAHLAANEVSLDIARAAIGPWLKFDIKTERFVGPFATEANAMVSQEYRAPFVVLEKV